MERLFGFNGVSGCGLAFLCWLIPLGLVNATVSSLPLKGAQTIDFAIDEATWLSVDVAPDGGQLIIEVLGDLYLLPIDGGTAQPLIHGLSFDSQPRFSPDGQSVAFISDRDGSEELWVHHIESAVTRRLSETSDRSQMASPVWSPDGEHVVVSRTSWPLRTFELWAHPVNGGSGVRLTQAKATSKNPE